MSILVSRKKFIDAQELNPQLFISKEFQKVNNFYVYLAGHIFSSNLEQVIDAINKHNTSVLSSLVGEFTLVLINQHESEVSILTDKAGRELLFYSADENFCISKNFWEIAQHLQLTGKSIDSCLGKNWIFLFNIPEGQTYLKNVFHTRNGTLIRFKEGKVNCSERYWYFKLKKKGLTHEDKLSLFDESMHKSFSAIASTADRDTIFGVGISGGFDSRILPYYAQKHDLRMRSFIIGTEYPHYLLRSNDHNSAYAIAKYYNMTLSTHEINELPHETQHNIDCALNPFGGSQIFKISNFSNMDFNTLLTGATGTIVGASPLYRSITQYPAIKAIILKLSALRLRPAFLRSKKALNYLFNTSFDQSEVLLKDLEGIVDSKDFESFESSIKKELALTSSADMSLLESIMNYSLATVSQKNKSGSFESLLKQINTYTPYTLHVLDAVQYLDEDDLYDRVFFENYIKRLIPDLANIRGQDHKNALSTRLPSRLSKFISMSEYLVRGTGVMSYAKQVRSKEFLDWTYNQLKESDIANRMFNVPKLILMTQQGQLHYSIILNTLKISTIENWLNNPNSNQHHNSELGKFKISPAKT